MRVTAAILLSGDFDSQPNALSYRKSVAELMRGFGFEADTTGNRSLRVVGDEALFRSVLGVDPTPGSHTTSDAAAESQDTWARNLRTLIKLVDVFPPPIPMENEDES